ncbi:cuticle protein 6-like [Homalodisca vitripennis]|uniref:cuticle protein 6-like n=1 Tax=Homalodisca vitripennis TaxID=197043 RepID=UPI001EEC0E45|nr:cuticle protein 6-like [Homalodisca vitripennis]KAG8306737.1 hypothetical protein J6590_040174 [Homalodisca vitripennis]
MICIVLMTLLACAQAQIVWPVYPLPYLRPLTSAQFHAQDGLGQFNFGYAGNNQFRSEARLLDGSVRGSYSYVDPNNKLVRVVYIADSEGYRVLEGNNLPTVPAVPAPLEAPAPVDYTPEVAAARAEFEKTYKELAAKAAVPEESEATEVKSSEERRKRSAVLLPALYSVPSASVKVKVTESEKIKDVISPANTTPVKYSDAERSVPVAPLVLAPASYHYVPPYHSYFYTL